MIGQEQLSDRIGLHSFFNELHEEWGHLSRTSCLILCNASMKRNEQAATKDKPKALKRDSIYNVDMLS